MQGLDVFCVQPFKDALRRGVHGLPDALFWPPKARAGYAVSGRGQAASGAVLRHSAKREYALLYDTRAKRYYAKLHLLSRTDAPFENAAHNPADRFCHGRGRSTCAAHRRGTCWRR